MDGSQRRVLIRLSFMSWANGLTIDPVGKLHLHPRVIRIMRNTRGVTPVIRNTRLVIPAILTDSYPKREPGTNDINLKRSGRTNM